MITRFAPTPSGYLHAGNAVNATLVDWLARANAGRLLLRIDDADAARSRPAYVDDIFQTLSWLGIAWHDGPRDPADFAARFSQQQRTEHYRTALDGAITAGLPVYACRCSRRELRGTPTGGCPGGCREAGHVLTPGISALRVRVPSGIVVDAGDAPVHLDRVLGDFVVWRRDDLPAYQVVSLVEDDEAGVTHIVRGEDLRASTAAQRHLAPYFHADAFLDAVVLHHGLITDANGAKLSKSQAESGPLERSDATREEVRRRARILGAPLGITD